MTNGRAKLVWLRDRMGMQLPMATKNFSEVVAGLKGRIIEVTCDCEDARRLQEMGLVPGTEFRVLKVAPLGDPVEIEVRGYRLCLRKREAACLEFEPIDAN